MKQPFKIRLRRAVASALAVTTLVSQPILGNVAYAAEPKSTGYPVKVAEQNPFDGLYTSKHSTKISDYNANVMEVEISGEKYLAYCLNPNRYGSDNVSGGAVGSSGYSVQVYDLDDPALQNVPDFQLDQSILLAMQGVIASGGYTGGGDAAAGKLMDPYDASRPLYKDHLQAYAVTKYAMWSLASGWYGPDWKVYSGSAYKPQDNAYLLQSLTNIIGWGTNWKEFNDENLYVNPMDYDSDGDVWTEDPATGEQYVEFQVITGKTGDNRGHVSLGKEYTVTPSSSLPAGFHLEKTDGTRITGSTTLRGAVSSSYGSEDKFRLVAEAETELSALGRDAVVASVSTEIEAFVLKYGVAIPPAGYSKVQNYALIPENTWKQVSADVKLSVEAPTTSYSFRIQKVDGSTALSGAEFRVESADGSETYDVTTPSSGIVTVNVKKPGTFFVKETKAPSGYSLDSTRYSVNVENGKEVTLTVQNSKDAGLKIFKYDANTDEPLSGAVFTVTNIGTGWSTDVTTGDTGLAILSNLEPGDYRIEEKTPPAGYLPAENPVQTIKLEADTVGQVVYRREYNEMLLSKVTGTNNSVVQERYFTVSVVKKNVDEARTWFSRVGTDLLTHLSRLSSVGRELDLPARLQIFRDFFREGEPAPPFDWSGQARRGHSFKDWFCPDAMEFESDCFRIDGHWGRVLYLRDYASYLKDSMIAELCGLNRSLMLSIDILPVPTDEAVREIQNRMLGIETNAANWQRRQNDTNNFSAVLPYDMEQQRRETREMLEDLTNRDQRMMFGLVTLVHLAESKEQLDSDTESIVSTARRHLCQMSTLRWQQKDGLDTVLPYGLRRIQALRTLTTESTAVLIPFRAQEILQEGGIYYGQNAVSKNMIVADRRKLLNGNSFALAFPAPERASRPRRRLSASPSPPGTIL